MKILSADQIRRADQFTIESEPIASIDLMERASERFTTWFISKFNPEKKIKVICGSGNNGGDGLAVARMLSGKHYTVSVFTISGGKTGSPDFEKNKMRFEKIGLVTEISSIEEFPNFHYDDIVIDALFGSGLTRPAGGLFAEVIKKLNDADAHVVSIDIPSGLFCDVLEENPLAVRSSFTVTFQMPKLTFFFKENAPFVGQWTVLDIGLNQEFLAAQETKYNWLTPDLLAVRKRDRHSHKGNFGRALLVAGGKGKMGAAVLASRACLRAGVGLLIVVSPKCGTSILQTAVPEAMVNENGGEEFLSKQSINFDDYDAIGVGPGIGQEKQTRELLVQLLEESSNPLVIDADALNLLGANRELLEILPENSILTPHPKEFERIAGSFKNSQDQFQLQQAFSRKYKIIVILKGGYTSISDPSGNLYINTAGNPGMATAGSGDVLTGILTGILAQGHSPLNSALLGVYLHSKSGDLAVEKGSEHTLIAGDLIENLPAAFRLLSK